MKYLLTRFSESRLEYCNRIINRDADVLTKRLTCNDPVYCFFYEWMNLFFFSKKRKSSLYQDSYIHFLV